jgi:hypothetical protein
MRFALASIARVLPPEKAPTIFQIPTLLSNDEWREAVLPFLPRTAQQFVENLPVRKAGDITVLVIRRRAAARMGDEAGFRRPNPPGIAGICGHPVKLLSDNLGCEAAPNPA